MTLSSERAARRAAQKSRPGNGLLKRGCALMLLGLLLPFIAMGVGLLLSFLGLM